MAALFALVLIGAAPSLGVAQSDPPAGPGASAPDSPSAQGTPNAAEPSPLTAAGPSPGTVPQADSAPRENAPAAAPQASVAGRADLPHDLSPWGMFLSADWVVKAVMIGLAFASLVTWTIFLAKSVEVVFARARANQAFGVIASARSLSAANQALVDRGGPAALMARAAGDEMSRSASVLDHAGDGGVKERVVSRLVRIEAQAGRRLTRGTGLLATIGATAPFVGLFGTVWGIMNAFIGISQSQTTNLAVVAPGIAEALLTTAFGLVAAIPAVVIYNVFARAVTGYRQALADAAAGVEQLVSRDLDFRKMPGAPTPDTLALAAE